ncbi:unnamed protein product [Camellia sinensis]
MESFSFNQQSNHGIMDELEEGNGNGVDHSISSSSSSEVSSSSIASSSSSESDLMEETTSSASSSPPLPSVASGQLENGPLHDMSSLMPQLPFKRGLSKHFQGKSQSFTSLANVRCLEDLAKPENPYNKRLKTCKSYGGLLDSHRSSSHLHLSRTTSSSRFISKGASSSSSSRGSFSSLTAKRPPLIPPHRSTSTSSISNQTPLFA